MQKLIFFLFFLIILYGIYNARKKERVNTAEVTSTCQACKSEAQKREILEKELSQIDTPEYIVRYIEDIINHGSDTLGFKGGVMEGGYVAKEDAHKIACYVLELSGRKCPHPYPEDAAMFYTSVCGGCHGNDGKGLGGNYPDLTRKKLLGIERREAFLRSQIERGNKAHHHSR